MSILLTALQNPPNAGWLGMVLASGLIATAIIMIVSARKGGKPLPSFAVGMVGLGLVAVYDSACLLILEGQRDAWWRTDVSTRLSGSLPDVPWWLYITSCVLAVFLITISVIRPGSTSNKIMLFAGSVAALTMMFQCFSMTLSYTGFALVVGAGWTMATVIGLVGVSIITKEWWDVRQSKKPESAPAAAPTSVL